MPLRAFLDGQDGEIRLPVPCYLIKHSKGMVLFDSGLNTDLQQPESERNQLITRRFCPEFIAGEELTARLSRCEVDVAKVRYLIGERRHFLRRKQRWHDQKAVCLIGVDIDGPAHVFLPRSSHLRMKCSA